jgi:hypothetical protein
LKDWKITKNAQLQSGCGVVSRNVRMECPSTKFRVLVLYARSFVLVSQPFEIKLYLMARH